MRGLLGCAGLLVLLVLAAGEAFSFIAAHRLLGAYARDLIGGAAPSDTILPILVLQVVAIVAGVLVVKSTIAALPMALMGSVLGQGASAGRLIVRILAGILLIVPGFFLDLVALLLLLPPVQALLASKGQAVAMSLVRRQMGKMFGGGMPGMPGGMPGAGFPFPGMQPRSPLTPDARLGKGGKIVDVTAERVDKG